MQIVTSTQQFEAEQNTPENAQTFIDWGFDTSYTQPDWWIVRDPRMGVVAVQSQSDYELNFAVVPPEEPPTE